MPGRKKGSVVKDRAVDAATLRDMFKPIYKKLEENGVPEEDMPTPEYLLSRLVKKIPSEAVDDFTNKITEWAKSKP